MYEGFTPSYVPTGKKNRVRTLKNGLECNVYDIPAIMQNEEALEAVRFFFRWKRLGLPYGDWGNNPNILIELVELLAPIDEFYRPRMI